MVLTDNELGMIEQLTYLGGDAAEAAGISGFSGITGGQNNMTIGQILECFDENALKTLESKGDQAIGLCSAKEWAGIIRYLKTSKMKDLVLKDTMVTDGDTLALCFEDKNNPNEAIVAFKGTSGGEEWKDNVEGLNKSDTECQKEALDFIERLPYDDITVTGHSKGGNKAMYVTITSSKVTRCVAYDGQGFSQEFMDKYWAEIQAKGGSITTYSLSTDYVHALLFPVPNANQIYCQGYGVNSLLEHHSPNSFFMTDENGNIIVDEFGNPIIVQIVEDESIVMLHEFTTFVLNNAGGQDKEQIIGYLSELLSIVFAGGEIDSQAIIDYCLEDPETLAIIIAYLIKYMEVNDLSSDDINKLLQVLGLDSLDSMFTFEILSVKIVSLSGLIDFLKEQLTDGDDDWLLKMLASALKMMLKNDLDIDVYAFWEKIDNKVREIDGSGGCCNAIVRTGEIRDFSIIVYNALMSCINKIEAIGGGNVSSWSNYSNEEWYSPLLISVAIRGINAYFSKLTETNQTCKTRIDTVFENVTAVDNSVSNRMLTWCQTLKDSNAVITTVAESIK